MQKNSNRNSFALEFSSGPLNRVPFQESINSLVQPNGHYRESIILNYAPRRRARDAACWGKGVRN